MLNSRVQRKLLANFHDSRVMAGNEWINGYLEAIIDAGGPSSAISPQSESLFSDVVPLVPGLAFSPTKYFVEEVINSFDEADLYKTWIKVVAMRNTKERSNRLENMCWRIWNLARKKKQVCRSVYVIRSMSVCLL